MVTILLTVQGVDISDSEKNTGVAKTDWILNQTRSMSGRVAEFKHTLRLWYKTVTTLLQEHKSTWLHHHYCGGCNGDDVIMRFWGSRNSVHNNLLPGWIKVLQNPCKCCIWPQKALKLPYKEVTELWGVARILYTGSMLSMKMTIYTHLNSELPWYRVRCVSLDRMLCSGAKSTASAGSRGNWSPWPPSLVGNSCTSLTLHESSLWLWSTVVK